MDHQCAAESTSIYWSTCDVGHYVVWRTGMEQGNISYNGRHRVFWSSPETNRCRALTPLPRSPLLPCHPRPIILQSQHGMEGKANITLLSPCQHIIEHEYCLDVAESRMDQQCVVEVTSTCWSTCDLSHYVIWKRGMGRGSISYSGKHRVLCYSTYTNLIHILWSSGHTLNHLALSNLFADRDNVVCNHIA